jgi:hypothetical protein
MDETKDSKVHLVVGDSWGVNHYACGVVEPDEWVQVWQSQTVAPAALCPDCVAKAKV